MAVDGAVHMAIGAQIKNAADSESGVGVLAAVSSSGEVASAPEGKPASRSKDDHGAGIAVLGVRRRLDPLLFASTSASDSPAFTCKGLQIVCEGRRAVGPASPSGNSVEAPAAALIPAPRTTRIPEIPPVGSR
ncbi:hypothetical protein CN934_28060 [Ensifer sp. MMN_5]|nr:hypothetical protein CN934_28060 [Ensifer sp. MMN_5]